MTRIPLIFVLVVTASCSAASRDASDTSGSDTATAEGAEQVPAVAYRLPQGSGTLRVYSLPSLEQRPWGAGGRVGRVRSAIGTDLIGRRLLYRDSSGSAASFDLVAQRERVAARGMLAAIGPDGTLLVVDSAGAITESQPWGQRGWPGAIGRGARAAFAGMGQRLLVIRGDSLLIVSRENGVTASARVPAGATAVASRDGDAVAFITDSGLVVFEDRQLETPWSLRLGDTPREALFSPSGHRIYVLHGEKDNLTVVDRFSQQRRASIGLPGRPRTMRFDPWGRILLVIGEDGETWVVSMARGDVIGRLRTEWSTDLPAVSENGVLLTREGRDVVARDVRTLDSLGVVAGGASDLWFAGRWVATSATAGLRAQVADQAGSRQPVAGSRPQPAPSAASSQPPATSSFWTQLMATRDEPAARAMAERLGRSVRVMPPPPNDDMWRVMVGPFTTRDAADSAGRAIGGSYWVVDRSRESRP